MVWEYHAMSLAAKVKVPVPMPVPPTYLVVWYAAPSKFGLDLLWEEVVCSKSDILTWPN